MLRRILVPLDGSPFAEVALPVARRLAIKSGADVTLVKVHEPLLAAVPAADLPAPNVTVELEIRTAEEAYLTKLAGELTTGGAAAAVELVDGRAGVALTERINRKPPDLVVMATHGRGALSRFWLGSVADYLLRHSSVPLLLLRPEGRGEPAPSPRFSHGIVALDRSEEALAVLGPVGDLALATGAKLTLLTVVEPILGVEAIPPYPMPVPEGFLESLRVDALAYLDRAAATLRARKIEVTRKVVVRVGVPASILEELDEAGADFIAMTTHGAGGLERFLIGSVADKVIRGATKPVLVVKA